MSQAIVFTDADNTLWDTDAVFAKAQLELLNRVEDSMGFKVHRADRLGFVREIDQRIAELHHSGLRYPVRLLAVCIAQVLQGRNLETAVRRAVRGALRNGGSRVPVGEIEREFLLAVRGSPALRPGVHQGLNVLAANACPVIVVTEGHRTQVAKLLQEFGLLSFITKIIEAPKRPELFARIRRLSGLPPRGFMVGDQLDRDIAPAKAAGLVTVYFPGGFRPKWAPTVSHVKPDFVVSDFADVTSIVLGDTSPAVMSA